MNITTPGKGDSANSLVLKHLWRAGVEAVAGRKAVAEALREDGDFLASLVIAVGKAACSMFLGARDSISRSTRSIIVTKYHHVDPDCRSLPRTTLIEAGHPVPDEQSLRAGRMIYQAVTEARTSTRLLLLVSGGASALAEHLLPEYGLQDLRRMTDEWLASGKSIAEINRLRSRLSCLKAGKLLSHFHGCESRVYALSDVEGDSLAVIGGGIGDPARTTANVGARVVASNSVARHAVATEAGKIGLQVRLNEESLYQDVARVADQLAAVLAAAKPGVYIWGGEPAIELPANPGAGGRNQSLALELALRIRGRPGITVLVPSVPAWTAVPWTIRRRPRLRCNARMPAATWQPGTVCSNPDPRIPM